MNAPANFAPRFRYSVWVQTDDGKLAYREKIAVGSLGQIEHAIANPGYFGRRVFVREHDSVNEVLQLHVYQVRKGKWLGCYDERHIKIYAYTADRLFSLPIEAFEPVEPWRYEPGCDVVGASAVLLEGSAA